MKKIGLAVAVATAMGATSVGVQAYTTATFDAGQLVPQAWSIDATTGTFVGLVSSCPGTLYWTWFDEQSRHVVDDSVPMTKNDMWSWNLGALTNIWGQRGYALFLFDREADPAFPNKGDGKLDNYDDYCLASAAFWVDVANADVAYVPTFPVDYTEILPAAAADLTQPLPNYNAIIALQAGAQLNSVIYKRYLVDGVLLNEDTTEIVTWTVCKPPGSQSLRWYNDNQDWISANYPTPNDELNWYDPEAILIATTKGAFKDGVIPWTVKAAANPNAPGGGAGDNLRYCDHKGYNGVPNESQAAVSWSQMWSSLLKAAQTILNSHNP